MAASNVPVITTVRVIAGNKLTVEDNMIRDKLRTLAGASVMVLAVAGLTWLASPNKSHKNSNETLCKSTGFKVDEFGHIVPCTPLANRVEVNSTFNQYLTWKPEVSSNYTIGKWTAIYNIKAHTVYLPNGTQLEAHSGRNEKMDNPRFVTVKNQGPTPPAIYTLSYRERPFHGVTAIRLTPKNKKDVYNRDGFLAHPYFLGKRGDSMGCVSFKHYNVFLDAYRRGEVKDLIVVSGRD